MAVFSLRRWFVVAALAICAVMTGVAWAASSPVGSSPDDDYHLASVWCPPPVEQGSCQIDRDAAGAATAVYVPEKIASASACYAFHPEVSASCQEAFSDSVLKPTDRFDKGEYPGGYYRAMNRLVGPDVERSVTTMRIVNVLLAVLLVGAALWATPARERYPVLLAVLGTSVPLGLFVVASMNPAAWAYAGLTAVWVGLYGALRSPALPRQIVGGATSVVGGVLAVNARTDSTIFLVGLTALMFIVALERPWVRPVPIATAAINVVLAVVSFVGSRAAAVGFSFHGFTDRDPAWVLYNNIINWPSVFMGSFGIDWGIGWLDTRMTAGTWAGASLVVLGLLFAGLAEISWRKVVGLIGMTLVLVALPLFMLQTGQYVIGEAVQPRYLLPLIPPLVWVALRGRETPFVRVSAAQAWTVVGALAVASTLALQTNMRRYITGLDGGFFFGPAVEWWDAPLSPKAWWVLGSLAFVGLLLSIPVAVRDAQRPERAAAARLEPGADAVGPRRGDGPTPSLSAEGTPTG